MSFGLTLWDADGKVVLDPHTFTVRQVDRFPISTTQRVYARPKVTKGMFCVFQSRLGDEPWLAPVAVVGDGTVSVRGVVRENGYTDGLECLVMAYV
jgi:hypothetical protein